MLVEDDHFQFVRGFEDLRQRVLEFLRREADPMPLAAEGMGTGSLHVRAETGDPQRIGQRARGRASRVRPR